MARILEYDYAQVFKGLLQWLAVFGKEKDKGKELS